MNIKKRIEALKSKSSVIECPMISEQIARYERAKELSAKARVRLGYPAFDIETAARMTELTRRLIEELRRAMSV